ncbi:hypothetical protein PQ472_08330 [Lacticaseibacillus pabuli]|uniref:Uncharacterized protein n=1 Tax=Lacticaseibacillus pabuli TaxID=3025672 RepID=A0ABY7WP39_9LACO|nr:hypothetical protein [Lacticaseibacillus sp. KACC 23028]WDF81929.1 hypothetical protein PQ472_08330 [Lacticaseibacillus sp. KACC 23028]
MLDVKDSVKRLSWTVEHHFLHIQNQHPFMRAWAVQFELAYTDFRTIQMALQLAGESFHPLLAEFAKAYEDVYAYEYEFAANGLDGFNAKFGDKIDDYQQKEETLLKVIAKIDATQPE